MVFVYDFHTLPSDVIFNNIEYFRRKSTGIQPPFWG